MTRFQRVGLLLLPIFLSLPLAADWLTFTPDSKKLYVANAHSNFVSVIDVAKAGHYFLSHYFLSPTWTRCCTSSNLDAASCSGHNEETAIATKNESGIDTSPGLRRGNHAVVFLSTST